MKRFDVKQVAAHAGEQAVHLTSKELLAGSLGRAPRGASTAYIAGSHEPLLSFGNESGPSDVTKPSSDFAAARAREVTDAVRAACQKGWTVLLPVGKSTVKIEPDASAGELKGTQQALSKWLRRSVAARAGAQALKMSRNPGNANAPGWLGRAKGEDPDGRPRYDKGSVFNTDLTRVVWETFDSYLEGMSLSGIADAFTKRAEPLPSAKNRGSRATEAGAEWKAETVKVQLRSPAAIGLYGANGDCIDWTASQGPDPVRPALISWKTFRLVHDLLSTPLEGEKPSALHLLTGRVYCDRCREDHGEADSPMAPREPRPGHQLRCQRGHVGPVFDEFERQLLSWLHDLEDVAGELHRILPEVTIRQLRDAMDSFAWPPESKSDLASLEEAVRAYSKATAPPSVVGVSKVRDFIRAMQSERDAEQRAEMRRKLRNVLRRHIAKVYVREASHTESIGVEKRPAFAFVERAAAFDGLLNPDGSLRAGVRLMAVTVHRIGQHEPDPVTILPMAIERVEMPPGTDWERRLLEPEQPQREVNGPAANGSGPASGGAGSGSDSVTTSGTSSQISLALEWTGYWPRAEDGRPLPWGVHIGGAHMDALAHEVHSILRARASGWTREKSDLLAFGMLLSSLQFFAVLEQWLDQVGADPRRLPYRRVSRIADEETPHCRDPLVHLQGKMLCKLLDAGEDEKLAKAAGNLLRGDEHWLRDLVSSAAHLEGYRWSQAAEARSPQLSQLSANAIDMLRSGPEDRQAPLRALALAFERDVVWGQIAKEFSRLLRKKRGGAAIARMDGAALRASLQANRFPPRHDEQPCPIHLHGRGRVIGKVV